MAERRTALLVGSTAGSLAAAFDAQGWASSCVTAMADALQQARQQPAVVVTRGAIDGGTALDLLQKFRRSAHTALVPVVAIVASEDETPAFEQWGAQAVLVEPVTETAIVNAAVQAPAKRPPAGRPPDQEILKPARLRALERTGLLDTPPEEFFDRMAHIAAHVLDVPVVLMSLVDRHRQFFKTQVGLTGAAAEARQTPLSHSYCQWVVSDHGELVVHDARVHPLLSLNPATSEMGLGAYAGIPLRADTVETIGSFCAIDLRPRRWEDHELETLREVARIIEGLTVLRQSAVTPPETVAEYRVVASLVGQAVQATTRLASRQRNVLTDDQQASLLSLAGDLGRRLAALSVP